MSNSNEPVMRLQLDWDGPNYFNLNGFRPVFDFLQGQDVKKDDRVKFVTFPHFEKVYNYSKFFPRYEKELTSIKEANKDNYAFQLTWNVFDDYEQFLTELTSEIFFSHKFPLSLGLSRFVFHLEDVKSLFLPLAIHFDLVSNSSTKYYNFTNNHASEFESYRRYIANILASDNCLAIFCHYKKTAEAILKLFPEYRFDKKIKMLDIFSLHHEYQETIKREINDKKYRLLFTHSFRGDFNSI